MRSRGKDEGDRGPVLGLEMVAAQRQGLSFLSDGMEQSGWYELRTHREGVGDFVLSRVLLASVGGRWRYFSVLPRARQGSLKTDVVPEANLLWLDVDSREALAHLGVFEELGLAPSAVVDSGGGFWLYWKLDRLVGTDQVEEWSRRLNLYARERVPDVDEGCWNRNRCARLVGTVHEETEVVARFLPEVSSWARFDPASVEQALAGIELPSTVVVEPVRRNVSVAGHRAEVASVFNRFRWYLVDPPTEEEVHERGQTRHEIEFALAAALVHDAGCSDDEVEALFDEWQVLKHEETKRTAPGNPYGYLDRTLARVHAETVPSDRPPAVRKRQWTGVDRGLVLRLVGEAEEEVQPLSVSAACEAILVEYPGVSYRTAENALAQLAKSGYVEKQKNPSARGKIVVLTARGSEFLAQEGFQRGFHLLQPIRDSASEGNTRRRLLRRSRRPGPEPESEAALPSEEVLHSLPEVLEQSHEIGGGEREEEPHIHSSSCVSSAELFGFAATRYQRHAGLDTPDEDLPTILRRNWIDDEYRISFLGRQATRTIQFLTDWDDRLPKVLFYEQLFIGWDEYPCLRPGRTDTQPVFRSFVSQRDRRVGGVNAPDPIAQHGWSDYRKPIEIRPYPWTFGLAVELTSEGAPVMRNVVGCDGIEKTLPAYGLVVERDWVFWESLRRARKQLGVKKLTSAALRVHRSGPRRKHEFAFEVAHEAIDFEPPADALVDLDQVLDELGSPERIATYVTPLADDHCPWSNRWS